MLIEYHIGWRLQTGEGRELANRPGTAENEGTYLIQNENPLCVYLYDKLFELSTYKLLLTTIYKLPHYHT